MDDTDLNDLPQLRLKNNNMSMMVIPELHHNAHHSMIEPNNFQS